MKHFACYLAMICLGTPSISAQTVNNETTLHDKLENYFSHYKPVGAQFSRKAHLSVCELDTAAKTIRIMADNTFAEQAFTPQSVKQIYQTIGELLPEPYNTYDFTILTHNRDIHDLIPNRLREKADKSRQWTGIDYRGEPWVKNVSSPLRINRGLQGRHIALWASHGYYYNIAQAKWIWQRPKLFATTEDLFTQTIVVPYLIPMLENAGAIVFTPRERAWQKTEIIVDNDGSKRNYIEATASGKWKTAPDSGFAFHEGPYIDGENPFRAGTARMVKATGSKSRYSLASYQPDFPESGSYAVYVSYQTLPNSIDDAHYTIWHKGERTEFRVNQQMGGGTWVYLGTFEFEKGYSEFNRVTLTSHSSKSGMVTTDAVRFGGGMGNIQRGSSVSGMPRALEGARYYAQWAGMPYDVYSSKNGTDDYGDDINARSNMVNLLGGGSPFMPNREGRHVPFELSLAIHSDAGFHRDGKSLIGSLSICTTDFNEGQLNSGVSRLASRDLADALLDGEVRDLHYKYGRWNRREIYDRNYSETRQPEVPSAILETLSHQNFADMRYALDPNFRFTLARSIYKSTLRYTSEMHGRNYVVTPLAPTNFHITLDADGNAHLQWDKTSDPQEPTAEPDSYIIYRCMDGMDFDNGTIVRNRNSFDLRLSPDVLYHFKVAAANQGGQSFTTETLSAYYHPKAKASVMIINGFHRLSSPDIRHTDSQLGFDLTSDPGITRGIMPGWVGCQQNFDRQSSNLGDSGDEWAGTFMAGNDFNYCISHARAIAAQRQYSIVSASSQAIESGRVSLMPYDMVDVLLGLERNDGHSLVYYKALKSSMQQQLLQYANRGGALLVSGAYLASDMVTTEEQQWLAQLLKCQSSGHYVASCDTITGLGTTFDFYHAINEHHYAAVATDALLPTADAFAAMRYADGQTAAVAYPGNHYRSIAIAFPFECIKSELKRNSLMRGIMQFLIDNKSNKKK